MQTIVTGLINAGLQYGSYKILEFFVNRTIEWFNTSSAYGRIENFKHLNLISNSPSVWNRVVDLPDINNKNIVKGIKIWAVHYMKIVNTFLSNKDKIQFDENEDFRDLIFKISIGTWKLMEENLSKEFNEKLLKSPVCFLQSQSKDAANAYVCWNTLRRIFEKYFEFKNDRNAFLGAQFEFQSDRMIEKIDPLLDKFINEFEEIREKYFHSIFRILMDLDLSCRSKLELTEDFFCIAVPKTDDDVYELLKYYTDEMVCNMGCDFSKLQNLIDCLRKLKQVSKTYNNVKIGYDFLKSSYNFYTESLHDMRKVYIVLKKKNPQNPGIFYTGYFELCSRLKEMTREYLEILEPKLRHEINNRKKNRNKCSRFKKNNQPRSTQQSSTIEEIRKTESQDFQLLDQGPRDENMRNLLKRKEIVVAPEKSLFEGIEGNQMCEVPYIEQIKKDAFIIDLNQDQGKLYIGDEEEAEIIEETNVLMEVMRQLCEMDRKEKLMKQEEKKQRAKELKKKVPLAFEEHEKSVKEKPKIQKLSKTHQELLKMLFSENPPYLTISGAEVEGLIKILEGKVVGDGNGSKFKVFWRGSNKQAGMYEVAHRADRKGYLTSEWAKKAGDAIKVGIDYGLVVIDTQFLSIESFDR